MKYTFTTYDEEAFYASRIATEIEQKLKDAELDTINKIYIITVEVEEGIESSLIYKKE